MQPEVSEPRATRQALEAQWRLRLEQTLRNYRAATKEYRRLLRQQFDGRPPDPASDLAIARRAESDALMEYSRGLRIFTDLTVHGKLPDPVSQPAVAASARISVIDDDESIRDSTRTLLRSAGYLVATFPSAERFLESSAPEETDCAIVDLWMPGIDGLELQRRLAASHPAIPVIFLTAHDDSRNRRSAMDAGAIDFLSKPFDTNALVTAVKTALTRRAVGDA